MQGGQSPADSGQFTQVELCRDDMFSLLRRAGENSTPWIDNHAVSVRWYPPCPHSRLSWRDYEALVLDGACPNEYLPVRISCKSCERGWDEHEVHSEVGQPPVQFREPDIVADGQTHSHSRGLGAHDIRTCGVAA